MAGFCRTWIPNFGLIAKDIYDKLQGPETDPFQWDTLCDQAFNKLKNLLIEVPALALPDLSKTFDLYVHERQGIAIGVLTQMLGPLKGEVAYFSKQLDAVAKGWPPCLRAVAAICLLIKKAEKLAMGQPMTVWALHRVS